MNILEEFITEIRKFGVLKLSRLSGISSNTIYGWTRKRIMPTLQNAQRAADAMGLEFLLFEKE